MSKSGFDIHFAIGKCSAWGRAGCAKVAYARAPDVILMGDRTRAVGPRPSETVAEGEPDPTGNQDLVAKVISVDMDGPGVGLDLSTGYSAERPCSKGFRTSYARSRPVRLRPIQRSRSVLASRRRFVLSPRHVRRTRWRWLSHAIASSAMMAPLSGYRWGVNASACCWRERHWHDGLTHRIRRPSTNKQT